MSLVAGYFVSRAIVRPDTTVAVATEQQGVVLNIMEGLTDGITFTNGIIFGVMVLSLGYLVLETPGQRRVVGYLGVLLGAGTLVVNLGLLLVEATDLWIIGILVRILASLLLLPIGWSIYRGSGHPGHADGSTSGTAAE